jgi:hypothetical protein
VVGTVRRWPAPPFTLDGVDYRCEPGEKFDGDVLLMMRASTWIPAQMSTGFVLADFYYDNERARYSKPWHQGGDMYGGYCGLASLRGFRQAVIRLENDRIRRAERDAGGPLAPRYPS